VNSRAASCHVEHTVAITRDGAEILTSSIHDACMPVVRRAG